MTDQRPTDEQLRELIAAGDQATARPWEARHKSDLIRSLCGVYAEGKLPLIGDEVAGRCMQENATYIALAANLGVEMAKELLTWREFGRKYLDTPSDDFEGENLLVDQAEEMLAGVVAANVEPARG